MEYPVYKSSKEILLRIPMEDITKPDLEGLIEKKTNTSLHNIHNGEGIVLPNTAKILSRSPLLLNSINSEYQTVVRYIANVTDTPPNSTIVARVESVISSGIICHVYHNDIPEPIIRAYVPISIHSSRDQERLSTIVQNDLIRIKCVNRKGSLSDKIITTIGSFVDLVKRSEPEKEELPKELPAPEDEEKYDDAGNKL